MLTEHQNLINKLQDIFAEYIVLSSKKDGYYRDFITGNPHSKDELCCAHYIKSRYRMYTFDETNCHAMTFDNNRLDEISPHRYRNRMIEVYGKEKVEEMERNKFNQRKFTKSELKDMIKHYNNQVKLLKLK